MVHDQITKIFKVMIYTKTSKIVVTSVTFWAWYHLLNWTNFLKQNLPKEMKSIFANIIKSLLSNFRTIFATIISQRGCNVTIIGLIEKK